MDLKLAMLPVASISVPPSGLELYPPPILSSSSDWTGAGRMDGN